MQSKENQAYWLRQAGFTYKEIGRRLGLNPGQVWAVLNRQRHNENERERQRHGPVYKIWERLTGEKL